MRKLLVFLFFSNCFLGVSNAQQVQSKERRNEIEIPKMDTMLVYKMMAEMDKELKLSDKQRPFVTAEVTKYLVERNRLIPFKIEPEEWRGRSNNNLFDFSQNLEKILDEDQIECFWGMKPLNKDNNIWWNIFVVY
ncbi:hypothetical protein ACTJKC_10690 [Pedobacter sp. 22226]|uniref:hypothetical protein n=1 Tax=Pedobacter sp. 22226 TaxID=3453894 RepID=UPI003F86B9FB